MQYTRLGNTGLIISRLAFGAMTFGSAPDSPMAHVFNTPEKTADALVGRSLDAGINFFDAADGYANGQSEQIPPISASARAVPSFARARP